MHTIENIEDVYLGIEALKQIDPRLLPVIEKAGDIPLRRNPATFESVLRIVVGQQVSVACADAIWSRFKTAWPEPTAELMAGLTSEELCKPGLSRPKAKTVHAIANEVLSGLDIASLGSIDASMAHKKLISIHGIGPWTANIFLLFCAGHPDVFPAGDVALQAAVADGLGLLEKPTEKELANIAIAWSPWRGVAARLFWAYYKTIKSGGETLPI
ncbi:MAG: DNA-3-methyladenine glycosylase 2 family protein [Cohaesibacteraceae bacterium]|nr:DNA-3-methyladenine glycosylase 2 family protein [Cohaesibacteraceae bacterium]